MALIKGRYVAIIEVNFQTERKKGMVSIRQMSEELMNGAVDNAIAESIEWVFQQKPKVTRQYADVYEVDVDGT